MATMTKETAEQKKIRTAATRAAITSGVRRDAEDGNVAFTFDSMADAVELSRTSFYRGAENVPDPSPIAWAGGLTFDEALAMAIEGWEEGTARVEQFTEKMIDVIGSRLKVDDYYYDVTGQDFDLDRVLRGEPECWLASEQVVVEAPSLESVKLLVNIGALGSVSPDQMRRKGAVACALVALLQKARRAVEVELVSRAMFNNGSICEIRILVKRAGDDMDLAKLAFAIIHPSMLRRVVFGIRETTTLGNFRTNNYGSSRDIDNPETQCDIYVGCRNGVAFDSDDAAEQWLLAELARQGVEIAAKVAS